MKGLLSREYTVELICADQPLFLSKLLATGVTVRDVIVIDQLKFRMKIYGGDIGTVEDLCQTLGCDMRILSEKGIGVVVSRIRSRVVLLCALAVVVFLTLFIPTRVYFVSVEGNQHMESAKILHHAKEAGVVWGASRKLIRSEKVKNALLEAIPELKWVGINTYGCRAVISVAERAVKPDQQLNKAGVYGIYAHRDGIISGVTATNGTVFCKTGQAVKAGQLLISGYTNTGLITRGGQAEGEVSAITKRDITALIPSSSLQRGKILKRATRWGLQIGKKQINLYFDSGNYDAGCGKIYKTIDVVLPGGFRLPISLVMQTTFTYEYNQWIEEMNSDSLHALASDYVSQSMIAGEILHSDYAVYPAEGVYNYSGAYICNEMIGKLQCEEIN